MMRWFNVAGPCRPDLHYMLPATERLPSVIRLINQQSYFVLHAPRQTGKTTAIGWLIIFDQRRNLPPIAERTTTELMPTPGGAAVSVIRAREADERTVSSCQAPTA